jgi:D-glycero-D-manno-heptose 1,7-bisphosphate phosphatase
MLFQAADRFQVQLQQSWLIGDHLTDIQAGLAAGCKSLLVLTGRGQIALEVIRQQKLEQHILSKVSVKRNLLEAVEYILATGQTAYE